MRGRRGMRVWQPDMERHETGLDAEASEAGQQNEHQGFWVVGRMPREVVKIPTAGQFMQHEESDRKENHAGVRGDQIPKSAMANFFFLPIEDDRKVSRKRHQFPYDEKDERIL